jgi:hypothetical protein
MLPDFERFERFVGEDGKPTLRASEYMREILRLVNLNTPIQGTGSPEGVITADVSQRYMDTAGASEAVLYIKQTGTGNAGWILG